MNRCLTRLGRLATQFNSSESKLLSRKFSTSAPPNFGAGTGRQYSKHMRVRKVLPEELLSKNVVVLTCQSSAKGGVCDVYIIPREVPNIISYLKPELVLLELCMGRAGVLTHQNPKIKVPTMEEMFNEAINGDGKINFAQLLKMLKIKAVQYSEFRVAYEEVMKYGGKVILGDRPSEITLARIWGKMTLWHKIKLPFSVISAVIFYLKHIWQKIMPLSLFSRADFPSNLEYIKKLLYNEEDTEDMQVLLIDEVINRIPIIHETLVHERDLYMSSALLNWASKHRSVVAVVGKGHLQGIKKHWKQPVVVKDLLEIP